MAEIYGADLEFEMGPGVIVINGGPGVCVVPTFADLYETTAEEVTVLKDDSYFGSGETVTFMVARNLSDGSKQTVNGGYTTDFYPFLKRKNGDYMVPKPRSGSVGSPAPANQIAEVVGSYFDHSEIEYGGTNTAFSPGFDPEAVTEENPATIDCSGFASLVLYAINYACSRYSGKEENIFGDYAGMTIPRNPRTCIGNGTSNRYCYNAAEMAMYFAQQNRLFYIDYEREQPAAQLQAGDVLFFSHDFVYTDPNTGENSADYGKRYLHIDHVGIVLCVYPESDTVLVANAGLPPAPRYWQPIRPGSSSENRNVVNLCFTQLSDFNTTTKQGAIVYARPIYPQLAQEKTQILARADFKGNVTSPTTANTSKLLARLFFKKPLTANGVYTLVAEGDLPNDPALNDRLTLLLVTADGTSSIHSRITELCKFEDKVSFVFVPPEDIADRTSIYLAVLLPSAAEGTDGNTYNLRKVAVYEGIAIDAPALIERVDNPVTFVTSVVNTESSMFSVEGWRDGARLHLHVAAPLAAAGSGGKITIGTIAADCFPKTGVQNNQFCSVNAEELRPLTISAGGVIKTMRKSTDEVGDLFQFDLTL